MNQEPIVLLHGLFRSLSDERILEAFGSARVFAPDLIGYGEFRDSNVSGLTLRRQAEHVERLVMKRDLHRVHLVGHSVGGAVAVVLASLRPEMTISVTSVEGNFTLKDAFWSQPVPRTL